jgi:hypothetical protein
MSVPKAQLEAATPDDMISYLCDRAYGVGNASSGRTIFADALTSQPPDKVRMMYDSARAEELRRLDARRKSRSGRD